ncbi:sulfotransferase [Sphingorhabdus sp. Alg239-R122]|uniref:sulfotransferase family protein n=1 Tax=Sphingorhabdus sp. Alg239-R122 TaxID=2305989 RepID=UPI0013DB6B2B|nr:sulfotransferase [Sphingorhabdus sp. Alg239-R122]
MKKFAISIIRFVVHLALFPLELILRAAAPKNSSPPIFIIGAPRSGTSLLYELMITRFHFSYISNLAHRFYLMPLAATWLGKSRITAWRGNFTSRFGHIAGWGAPNEGGWVWRRWLADGDWTDGSDFDETHIPDLRALTGGLAGIMDAPFLNKNVMHSNRLHLMHKIWPDAIFIHVRRDVASNVRSIVRAERKEGGPAHDGDHWWSVRPSIARDYIGENDVARATAQVIGVDQDINRDIVAVGAQKLLRLDYAQICNDPAATMDKIADFLSNNGVELAPRHTIPEKFSPPPSRHLGEEEEMAIAKTGNNIIDS